MVVVCYCIWMVVSGLIDYFVVFMFFIGVSSIEIGLYLFCSIVGDSL